MKKNFSLALSGKIEAQTWIKNNLPTLARAVQFVGTLSENRLKPFPITDESRFELDLLYILQNSNDEAACEYIYLNRGFCLSPNPRYGNRCLLFLILEFSDKKIRGRLNSAMGKYSSWIHRNVALNGGGAGEDANFKYASRVITSFTEFRKALDTVPLWADYYRELDAMVNIPEFFRIQQEGAKQSAQKPTSPEYRYPNLKGLPIHSLETLERYINGILKSRIIDELRLRPYNNPTYMEERLYRTQALRLVKQAMFRCDTAIDLLNKCLRRKVISDAQYEKLSLIFDRNTYLAYLSNKYPFLTPVIENNVTDAFDQESRAEYEATKNLPTNFTSNQDSKYKHLQFMPGASREEVKRIYRRLAMKYHPDQNPGNKDAEEKFKEINNEWERFENENPR